MEAEEMEEERVVVVTVAATGVGGEEVEMGVKEGA